MIPLVGKNRVFGQTEPLDQQRVEAGLEGTDRDEAPICALIGVVPGRREVAPATAQRPPEHAHVSHGQSNSTSTRSRRCGTVDHLPFSGAGCVKHGAEQPEEQHHRAAPEVTHQRGGPWAAALPPCHNAPDRAT